MKLALEYEIDTGRSGMDLTPAELIWRTKIRGERNKLGTLQMASAMATAMSGDEKAWDALIE